MTSTEAPAQWRFQRQFDRDEGDTTPRQRPDLLADRAAKLLSDEQIRSFLANGVLTLRPQLGPDFHQDMFDRFAALLGDDNDDNPGNNLLPLVPELQLLYDDPVIKGALTSVLGDGYMMHPHRVLHDNQPGSDAQVWHHDSYWGYKRKIRGHRPWWVMIMYYPQDIYQEIGPTGNIPGSQYIAQRLAGIDQLAGFAHGPAGTCTMIHYDIWHRKMKNVTDLRRYMVKFEFIRMRRPSGVTWDSATVDWRTPADPPQVMLEPVWRATWHWLGGRALPALSPDPATDLDVTDLAASIGAAADQDRRAAADQDRRAAAPDQDRRAAAPNQDRRAAAVAAIARLGSTAAPAIPALTALLGDANEVVGLNAAYALAHIGGAGRDALLTALRGDDGANVDDVRCFIDEGQRSEQEMIARNAAHGLVAAGTVSDPGSDPGTDPVAALIECARAAGPRVRKYACFALGELDSDAAVVVGALIEAATNDDDPAVRLTAVEALGLKRGTSAIVGALAAALSDPDDEVRFNGALALARLGPAAAPAVPALVDALRDGNRYTAGYAVEALERIATPAARQALIRYLKIARWCPLTRPDALF